MLVTFFVFVKTNTRKILSNLIYANETEKQLNKQTNKQTYKVYIIIKISKMCHFFVCFLTSHLILLLIHFGSDLTLCKPYNEEIFMCQGYFWALLVYFSKGVDIILFITRKTYKNPYKVHLNIGLSQKRINPKSLILKPIIICSVSE